MSIITIGTSATKATTDAQNNTRSALLKCTAQDLLVMLPGWETKRFFKVAGRQMNPAENSVWVHGIQETSTFVAVPVTIVMKDMVLKMKCPCDGRQSTFHNKPR